MVKLPVCFESRTTAASFRKLLDKKEYNYKRTAERHTHTKVSFVIAHEKTAMVYKYDTENSKIKTDIWEEKPSSGNISCIELGSKEKNLENELLRPLASSLPRKPWEYTITQKLRKGWLSQGIFRAKSKWETYLK